MEVLPRDCLVERDGQTWMTGWICKGTSDHPRREEWPVNKVVIDAVRLVLRLHDISSLPHASNVRTGAPVLFDRRLMRHARKKGRQRVLTQVYRRNVIENRFRDPIRRLRQAGALSRDIDDHPFPSASVVRISCIEVAAGAHELGDLAAFALGGWHHQSVALGYYGHVGQRVACPASTDVTEYLRESPLSSTATLVRRISEDDEPLLTGAGVDTLHQRVEESITNGAVTDRVLIRSITRGPLKEFSNGLVSMCVTPTNGLCASMATAKGRQGMASQADCQLGCPNEVLTPYHRARLELMRRYDAAHLGPHHGLDLRLNQYPDLLAGEVDMTDRQLVEVMCEEWPFWLTDALLAALDLEPNTC